MVTLSLLRHAKSAWNNPGLGDFDRPLAPRGQKAALRMGRFLAENDILPGLVLCSSAVRARETLQRVLPALPVEPDVRFDDRLYLAGPRDMIALLRETQDEYDHVMLVGHNPGMHVLALELVEDGESSAIAQLGHKFPTAALAVIDFSRPWQDISAGGGTLRLFALPRALAGR
jgi:phosphohistidine phosphatase